VHGRTTAGRSDLFIRLRAVVRRVAVERVLEDELRFPWQKHRSLLFEAQPFEWTIFGVVEFVVLLVSIAACLYPAWRASHLDPMTAFLCG
jgi:hypothetical protein